MRHFFRVALLLAVIVLMACRGEPEPPENVQSLKLFVSEDGLYRLNSQRLQAAGFPSEPFESDRIRLTEAGNDIPYHIVGEDLIFYGLAATDRYTAERAYLISAGEPGVVMPSVPVGNASEPASVMTRTLRLEQNLEYLSEASEVSEATENAPWFWQTYGFAQNDAVSFTLPGASDGSGVVRARFYGMSHVPDVDPDHNLRVTINGQTELTVAWDGQAYYEAALPLPAGALREGQNTIAIESISSDILDISKLDWIEIDYAATARVQDSTISFQADGGSVQLEGFASSPVILDITEPDRPRVVDGWSFEAGNAKVAFASAGSYVAASIEALPQPELLPLLEAPHLTGPQMQADLLIVTTAALASALDDLVQAREAQGLTVVVATVEEIYDTFGHGAPSPHSLHAFVSTAYRHWQPPAPRYLLLVGDATIDYRGYLDDHPQSAVHPPDNIVPSYLVPASFGGETVSDARLADVEGDVRPELAVGRWPVATAAEVRDLVQRTLTYEQSQPPDRSLFTFDGSSSSFGQLTERIVDESGFPVDKAHLVSGPTSDELAEALEGGAWVVSYVGHGSLQLWGEGSMLSSDNVGEFLGSGTVPIVLQFTCLTGLFAHPHIVSLSERMLSDRHGPPLIVGATSLTLSTHQEPFAVRLIEALLDGSVMRIGDALQIAKADLDVARIGPREVSDTFLLLGDPSAPIVRPSGAVSGQ